ncbi:MAG: acetylxylan esterase [Propionibacteriaceae bacterium]|nr:acetylxylan esterase [Propionibacteriaceae bacterium]
MARFDLDLDELRTYLPDVAEPDDFDQFWRSTLDESRAAAADPVVEAVDTPLALIRTYDVTFSGFAGDPIKAWLNVPAQATGPLPAVVGFQGYGGGRQLPWSVTSWAQAGYAYLFMDTRGQGSRWGVGGDTPDPHGSGPAVPGSMTHGVQDPATHFYRRVFTDAVRAVETVRALPQVDAARVAVSGASQGGAIALAAAGLAPGVAAALVDVPFLCHFRRAVGLTDDYPYQEVSDYLAVHRNAVERTFHTLSYFDGVNFAKRASAPAIFSVGLMDTTTPPSTVFAAYNHYAGEKQIEVYEFNGHNHGEDEQWGRQARWLAPRFGLSDAR